MRAATIIFRREMGTYLQSIVGRVTGALALLLMGVAFQVFGAKTQLSGEMLQQFFWGSSGVVMGVSIILSVRLVAEERQSGSLVLLSTSPVRETEIILGKFLAALAFLAIILAVSVYIPLLIKSEGKITGAQIFVGYLGLFLLGSATLAIGVFASTLARQQIVAAVTGAAIVVLMLLLYQLSRKLDAPMKDILAELDLWWIHFQQGFMKGVFNLKDAVYYVAVTYFFLLLSVKTLEAKRWQ
ncbi:MAG: ABC transporter permease subunit [Kofleriaceae bacterium]|nr:ABC transporter permease subunit [Kofleriaceae bacterium]MBE7454447.1 ABC transporter permease subunit [Kofleriaceae bacterium]MCL4228728.1 ABC transporter permease subunit [Myxococcales bacterium]